MIEIVVKNYLEEKLSVPVYLEYPEGETVPDMHIMVEKTGSGEENQICHSTIAIQSYGARLVQAIFLNDEVRAAMKQIVEINEIASAKLNSDYNFPDTERKKYRYQAVYDIAHY